VLRFLPPRLRGLCRNLGSLLGRELSGSSRAAFKPTKTTESDSGGVLGCVCWLRFNLVWIVLRRFADGFEEDLMRELVRIAGAFL